MTKPNWTDEEIMELYLERCAIREYVGEIRRDEAQRLAYYDVRNLLGRGWKIPDAIVKIVKGSDGTNQNYKA